MFTIMDIMLIVKRVITTGFQEVKDAVIVTDHKCKEISQTAD